MKFSYKAQNPSGQIQKGSIEAINRRSAIEFLLKSGLKVLEVNAVKENELITSLKKIWRGVKAQDFVLFSRQLSVLVDSKVPLLTALHSIETQVQNTFFAAKIRLIIHDIDGGSSFSDALAKHPDVFSSLYVNMVKAGESSGTLQKVLNDLADNIEKNYELTSRLKSAMYYPAFILVSMFVIGFIVMTSVLPKLLSVLKDFGGELPLQTRILMAVSSFFVSYWWVVLTIVISLAVLLFYYLKTDSGKADFDIILLKIPVLKKILNDIYIARFSENLSTLIQSGLPITTALLITADIVGNEVYRGVIQKAANEVKRGESIGSVFSRYEIIPPIVVQMIQVGESTGKIDFTLSKITGFYTREADVLVKNFTSLIEPIIMVILAIGVGILVSAVMLPIYQAAMNM